MTSNNHDIQDLWSDEAAGLADLDLLVYQSRLVGSEPKLVLWGGGNTSLKIWERDFRGRETLVLRVKGSGSDLKAVKRQDFPGVRMEDVLPLLGREGMSDEEMVEYLSHTLMEPASARPSIETLLHAFIPALSVVHSHADSILALTNNARHRKVLDSVFGDDVIIVPYRRPGFLLSKEVGEAVRDNPDKEGIVLLNHGLITWHDDPREAYRLHIELVKRAERYAADQASTVTRTLEHGSEQLSQDERRLIAREIAPILRGSLSTQGRVVLRFDDSEQALAFATGQVVSLDRLEKVLEAGAATPDHILNTKRTPLLIRPGEARDRIALAQVIHTEYESWVARYRAYFEEHASGQVMLVPVPRVAIVEGVGIFSIGKESRAASIASDIYQHTILIIEAAEAMGGYRSLSTRDAFQAEYWPLELYKLTLALPDQPLARRVALITGAAGAIGAGIARRFAAEGAHVVCADLDREASRQLVEELNSAGLPNRALAVPMDVTDAQSVGVAFDMAVLEYGGLDVVVSNAGIAKSAPLDELTLEDWEQSMAVNATGHFLVARQALKVMKAQALGGSLIFIATKNVTAPGKEFGAYSASKAAEAQLARVLALEGGEFGIRSNIINPDAIFAGSGLWSPEVREERARAHGIAASGIEEFYRKRNLLQTEVTADDVAEAALFYATDRSAKTTGSMMPVDGGLREAFPR